jgi:hypothetical protein
VALKSIGGFFSSVGSRLRGLFSGGLDRVGQAQVSLTMRGIRRLLSSPPTTQNPDGQPADQPPTRSLTTGLQTPESAAAPEPEVIKQAFQELTRSPSDPDPDHLPPGPEEPGPEPGPASEPAAEPSTEPTASGGIAVSDAIRRSAQLLRAVFGRDIPDEIYSQISLDPELPIAILAAVGCADEPIDFLTNLSPKAKHRIALGSFAAFVAGDVIKLILARRELASQIKVAKAEREAAQPQREADLRKEVRRQESGNE